MRFTQGNLKKIEAVFGELGYTVRYEKGSFQSGYCLVENRSIAVVNKFFDTEARINTLLDILSTLQYDESKLSEATLNSIKKWKKALDDDTTEEPSDATSTAP
jgi:hypothetical protein